MIDLAYKTLDALYNMTSNSTSNSEPNLPLLPTLIIGGIEAVILFYLWYDNRRKEKKEQSKLEKELLK